MGSFKTISRIILIFSFQFIVLLMASTKSQQPNDGFDDIKNRINKVNSDNCATKDINDLYLPEDAVSHLIVSNEIFYTTTFPNRTAILQLYNVAQSRSFHWSFIHQASYLQPYSSSDSKQLYYFLSTIADVSASSNINASAIYFAPDSVPHENLPLFAPRTFGLNRNTFVSSDLGAIPFDSTFNNYTHDFYKVNEWYRQWLPDNNKSPKQSLDEKTMYKIIVQYASNKNSTILFFGPPGPEEATGPVKFTRPYFDCGRTNKWLISAVVPIIGSYFSEGQINLTDFYPKYTAISVVEMEFEKIDINQCPVGTSNSGPNRFADTARCKKETTYCEPLSGYGLRRGGYQCHCKPGYRLPKHLGNPFMGEDLERASQEEYDNGFDCEKIESPQDLPVNWDEAPLSLQNKYLSEYKEYRNPKTNAESLHAEQLNIDAVMDFIYEIRPSNCHYYNATDLVLPFGMSYGAKEFFESDARTALRLAHFNSAFLQLSQSSGQQIANRSLTENEMIMETLAVVLGNQRIWSAGTYWERNTFNNLSFFAQLAYKENLNTRTFKVYQLDTYTVMPWYHELRKRWSANDIVQFLYKINIQDTKTGDYSFVVGDLESGYWTPIYYDCDGPVNRWLITYAAPFFGWDEEHGNLEFKGAVAVSIDALHLDVNQCDQDSMSQNAFKGTHKCDRKTTKCLPILGRQFSTGGYKCECVEGYEYPFNELVNYFDGELVESEFQNLIHGKATRYDIQQCRLAGSGSYIAPNITLFHMHTPDN